MSGPIFLKELSQRINHLNIDNDKIIEYESEEYNQIYENSSKFKGDKLPIKMNNGMYNYYRDNDKADFYNGHGKNIEPIEHFQKLVNSLFNFDNITPIESKLLSNIYIIGGSVIDRLMGNKYKHKDIDIFILSSSKEEFNSSLDLLMKCLRKPKVYNSSNNIIATRTNYSLSFNTNFVPYVYSSFRWPRIIPQNIQIILSKVRNLNEIFNSFDLHASKAAYSLGQQKILLSESCIRCIKNRGIKIDLSQRTANYESRLKKYTFKGFDLYMEGYSNLKINPKYNHGLGYILSNKINKEDTFDYGTTYTNFIKIIDSYMNIPNYIFDKIENYQGLLNSKISDEIIELAKKSLETRHSYKYITIIRNIKIHNDKLKKQNMENLQINLDSFNVMIDDEINVLFERLKEAPVFTDYYKNSNMSLKEMSISRMIPLQKHNWTCEFLSEEQENNILNPPVQSEPEKEPEKEPEHELERKKFLGLF